MVIKSFKIEPIQYTGSVSHFRAWMDRFMSLYLGRMIVRFPDEERDAILKKAIEENNQAMREGKPLTSVFDASLWSWQLHIKYSGNDQAAYREVWHVSVYNPTKSKKTYVPNTWATILAVERYPNNTIVEFLDGVYFRYNERDGSVDFIHGNMIGEMFSEYAEFIKDEWVKRDNPVQSKKENQTSGTSRATEKITIMYPGSIENFRTLIDELRMTSNYKWTSSKNEVLAIWDYASLLKKENQKKSDMWFIASQTVDDKKQNGQAVIQAFESIPNVTTVNFYDGKSFNSHLGFKEEKKIGESFDELVQAIKIFWEKTDKIETVSLPQKYPLEQMQISSPESRREINLQSKQAGRKINSWNPEAFDIMNDGNEKAELRAFEFWCEKQSIPNPKRGDRDAFKKAMKRESERRRRNR
jgi:hypothetical protein